MEKLQSVRYRKSSDVRFGSKANIGYSITSSALTSSAAPICARCSASSSKSFDLLPQLIDGGAQSVWWPVRCAAARSRSAGPHFLFPVGWWGSAASKASAQPTHMAVAVSASPRSEFTIRGMGVVGRWALSLRLGSAYRSLGGLSADGQRASMRALTIVRSYGQTVHCFDGRGRAR